MRHCPAAFILRPDLCFLTDSPITAGVETEDEGTVVLLVLLT
jgi:hypothetical protein